jgi:sugar/nucleoside kinase (ribokinase family)
MKILIAGELNPDLILHDYQFFPQPGKEVLVKDLELTLGSSSAICAVGLARLGNPVVFVGNIGTDLYSDFCVDILKREGIDVSLVHRRPDLKTGITVSITSPQDRALITYPGAIASLTPEDVPPDFASCGHLHVSGYFLQDGLRGGLRAMFAAARRAGLTTSLDPGWDPREEWPRNLIGTLEEVDVFLPSETEIQAITGCREVRRGIETLENGHTIVVGKLGADGCIARYQGEWIAVSAYPIEVVDTTGAGDSFDAGFLHAWLRRRPIDECLRFATACGALSTRSAGGTTAQATAPEVELYLHAHSGR